MLKSLTSQGLVLYNRNFREDDKLVKIFTEQAGKRMFFVKHAGKSKLAPVIQPLTAANLLMKINDDGLSYIEDYQDVVTYHRINEDLFIMPVMWRPWQMPVFRTISRILLSLLFCRKPWS